MPDDNVQTPIVQAHPTEATATLVEQPTDGGIKELTASLFSDYVDDARSNESAKEDTPSTDAAEDKVEQAPEATVQREEAVKPDEAPAPVEVPAHWPDEMKANFTSLPREAQEALIFQSKNLEAAYTKKFQTLQSERQRDAAFDGLVNQFKNDPNFARHVLTYGQQADAQQKAQDEDPYGLGPRPEDPLDRLQWDAAHKAAVAVEKRMMERFAPIEQATQAQSYQMSVQRIMSDVQRDPLFQETYESMHKYVADQPAIFRDKLFRTLDADPEAFLGLYKEMREQVTTSKQKQTAATTTPVQMTPATPPITKVVEQKAQAPLLESAGTDQRDLDGNKQKKTREKHIEAARKGDWQPYLADMVKDLGF